MKKIQSYIILGGLILTTLFCSCGEDRSGEYYALIGSKTWIYETMQQNYLYYQDIPKEENLDFFKKPSDFLSNVVSDKDKKYGVTFSHIDSVFTVSKSSSNIPTYGFEGVIIRANDGSNAIKVLYTQENSPAYEAGLKRNSLIIAADGKKIGSNDFFYITNPEKAYTFTLGKLNEIDFDTLGTVTMPAPRIVENNNILKHNIIQVGAKNALYICYNEFGDERDIDEIKTLFQSLAGQNVNDIILDLRYNPGGYVKTSQVLTTNLAPQEAIGNIFLKMIYNDKINKTDVYNFDVSDLANGSSLSYENLYVITSQNTASASEIVINCLKPYLGERLIQVGTATFGKNVAQRLFTDEVKAPMLEFWLTNSLLSNSKDFSDYFTNGLKPDFDIAENMSGELGELGTEEDSLMLPILYHIKNGAFPPTEDKPNNEDNDNSKSKSYNKSQLFRNSIDLKPKNAIIK